MPLVTVLDGTTKSPTVVRSAHIAVEAELVLEASPF